MKNNSLLKKSIALLTAAVITFSASFVLSVFAESGINPSVNGNLYTYEVEQGTLVKNAYVNQTIPNYSGTGSVNILAAGSEVTMNINVSQAGNYKVYVYGSNNDGNNKCDYFSVNNGTNYLVAIPSSAKNTWFSAEPGTENWVGGVLIPKTLDNGFSFNAGLNTIKISANWGYAYYDKVVLEKIGADDATTDVINKINLLPEKVTESARAKIEEAKSAYDALTNAQKSLVTNYSKLEEKLNILNPTIQEPSINGNTYSYETEICSYPNNSCYTDTAISGYSGSGYVFIMEGTIRTRLNVLSDGNYIISIVSANNDGSQKCDYVTINDDNKYLVATPATANKVWNTSEIGTENYVDEKISPKSIEGGIALKKGVNIVEIGANWGYCAYDKIVLEKVVIDDSAPKAVIAQIDELPQKITESVRSQIEAAKSAYDALTNAQKSLVTNYSKLEEKLNILNPTVQEPQIKNGMYFYETEICSYPNNSCYTDTALGGYSGSGYVYIMEGTIRTRLNVPKSGKYNIYVASANNDGGAKCDYVTVNDSNKYMVATSANPKNTWVLNQIGTENWVNNELKPLGPKDGIALKKGINIVEIGANWGYCAYDKIVLVPTNLSSVIDETNIAKINNLIANLPNIIESKDIQKVNDIKNLYNSLGDKDKTFVKDVEKLFRSIAMVNALNSNSKVYKGTMRYECEEGKMSGNSSVVTEKSVFSSFSGQGYVFLFDKSFDVDVYVEKSGYYHINIISGADADASKCDFFQINKGEKFLLATNGKKGIWKYSVPGIEYWTNGKLTPKSPTKGYYLKAGKNTITISANWGYCSYDAIEIYPQGVLPKTGDFGSDAYLLVTTLIMITSLCGLVVLGKKLKA